MTPEPRGAKAVRMVEKFLDAQIYLSIHGLLSEGERNRVRNRIDTWARKHGLRRKGHGVPRD